MRFVMIGISFFFTFQLFFPVYYVHDHKKKDFQNDLQIMYKMYDVPIDRIDYQVNDPKSTECYLLLIQNPEFLQKWRKSCYLLFPVEISLFLSNYLDFLKLHLVFLKNLGYNVIIVSENQYNALSLFLGFDFLEIQEIILNQELYRPLPFIWSIIEPRVCYFFQPKEICVQYEITKFIQRNEIYERVQVNTKWIINKKDLNKISKHSFEIFHQIGKRSKNFLFKEIILRN